MNVGTNNIMGMSRYETLEEARELCEEIYLAAKNSFTIRMRKKEGHRKAV